MIRVFLYAALLLLVTLGHAQVATSRTATKILEGAKIQAREGATYTVGYFKIGYPNGDIDRNKGVCTDVVIRALRHAGYDLQRLIHEDMGKRFNTYPRREKSRDRNIDHRRCPNQIWFFKTYGKTLTNKVSAETLRHWQPGDIVYWKLDSGLDHTGVISDRKNSRGEPYVIHNLGRCAEEDVLMAWKIVGHYRYPK